MKTVRNFIFLGPKSLQMVTSAMKLKTLANKWDLIKLKRFCSVKTNIKRRPSEWEKIFASKATDKGLISKYRNSSWSSISKKTNNPVNKWAEGLNGHFSEEDICMVLKQKNNAQHHYLLEKSISKLQWGITSYQSEWPSSKSLTLHLFIFRVETKEYVNSFFWGLQQSENKTVGHGGSVFSYDTKKKHNYT